MRLGCDDLINLIFYGVMRRTNYGAIFVAVEGLALLWYGVYCCRSSEKHPAYIGTAAKRQKASDSPFKKAHGEVAGFGAGLRQTFRRLTRCVRRSIAGFQPDIYTRGCVPSATNGPPKNTHTLSSAGNDFTKSEPQTRYSGANLGRRDGISTTCCLPT